LPEFTKVLSFSISLMFSQSLIEIILAVLRGGWQYQEMRRADTA
jgi:hypothetical protein